MLDRCGGAPLLHVLASHDLEHVLVVEIANDDVDLLVRPALLLDRDLAMVTVGVLATPSIGRQTTLSQKPVVRIDSLSASTFARLIGYRSM